MKKEHLMEFLELPVGSQHGPERPLAYGRCVYCGGEVPVNRGSFSPHNWGMRLCPGSWQQPRLAEPEDINQFFRV
jgi:hypothetical protein